MRGSVFRIQQARSWCPGFVKQRASLWRLFLRCGQRCRQETLVKLIIVCVCRTVVSNSL